VLFPLSAGPPDADGSHLVPGGKDQLDAAVTGLPAACAALLRAFCLQFSYFVVTHRVMGVRGNDVCGNDVGDFCK
jgi:hypothetical protein